jgi:hypothetical protein
MKLSLTTDFPYVIFIGDRSIDDQDLGRIKKDRVSEMKRWASKIKRVIKEQGRRKNINLAIVAANNHYAGFGPGTANIFRKMTIGLPEATWSKEEDDKFHLHSSSSDIQQRHNSKYHCVKSK